MDKSFFVVISFYYKSLKKEMVFEALIAYLSLMRILDS